MTRKTKEPLCKQSHIRETRPEHKLRMQHRKWLRDGRTYSHAPLNHFSRSTYIPAGFFKNTTEVREMARRAARA